LRAIEFLSQFESAALPSGGATGFAVSYHPIDARDQAKLLAHDAENRAL
jgi:hypothetical protein